MDGDAASRAIRDAMRLNPWLSIKTVAIILDCTPKQAERRLYEGGRIVTAEIAAIDAFIRHVGGTAPDSMRDLLAPYRDGLTALRLKVDPPHRGNRPISREEWRWILTDARARGLTPAGLAEEIGVDRQLVYNAAHRAGVHLIDPARQRTPEAWRDILLDAQARRMSARALARKMGLSRAAVYKAMHKTGIKLPRDGYGP